MTCDKLRDFSKINIDKDCMNEVGTHENELFYNCVFDKLNDLRLIKCDLNNSKFKTSSIKDALGFTLTLDCMSFKNVEYSPLLFDLLCAMMVLSKGNDEKRRKIREILGDKKMESLLKVLGVIE